MNNKFLAVIPARGGSKRLPNKNIKLLAGKPLIAWTIMAAKKSAYIDRILVSTDDEAIAKISRSYGAEIPFIRPKELAGDDSSTISVIRHLIDFIKDTGIEYEYVVLLQPTSPLRDNKDIDNAIRLLHEKKADAVISVSPVNHPPHWSNFIKDDFSMDSFVEEFKSKNEQIKNKNFYSLNGAIYICNIKRLEDENTLFLSSKVFAYIMDRRSSIDIDSELDFQIAEYLFQRKVK